MAIIIKEIRVVTTIEKNREKEIPPDWLIKVKEMLREKRIEEQGKRKYER